MNAWRAHGAAPQPCASRYVGVGVGVGLLWGLLAGSAAAAPEPPASLCAGTDDRLRPLPQTLFPAARSALALSAPDSVMGPGTVFRCMAGQVMVCFVGANLPCGERAAAAAHPQAAKRWCAAHPGTAVVPAVVTGEDMLGRWHCSGKEPIRSPSGEPVDGRGFVARIWKPLR